MLVLTRRVTQQIVFPTLGVTVSVVRVLGNVVRLGVDAPSKVPVLRGELATESALDICTPAVVTQTPIAGGIDEHLLRNCLNTATLALRVAEKQVRSCPAESELMIGKALTELEEVRLSLAQTRPARSTNTPTESVPCTAAPTVCRALLVEDNDNERQLLAGYLRVRGFDVVEASDGRSAICYLEESDVPDVMLLDMNMPRFNGAKAVHWIRERERLRSIRIFGVSGRRPARSRNGTECAGVDHWIEKPINPEVVVEQISRVMDG
jgi:carbon storage regulator CsrA